MGKTLCYKCGSIIPEGALRCPNCGAPAPLSNEELAQTSSRRFRGGASVPEQPSMSVGVREQPILQDAEELDAARRAETVRITPQAEETKTAPLSVSPPPSAPSAPSAPKAPAPSRPAPKKSADTFTTRGVLIAGLAAIGLILLIFFVSRFISSSFSDEKVLYAISELPLYSEAGAEHPSGTVEYHWPLEVEDENLEWAHVSYNYNGARISGYVRSDYLIDQAAVALLDSILYSNGSSMHIVTSPEERAALLYYYMYHLTPEERGRYRFSDSFSAIYRGHFFGDDSAPEDVAFLLTPQSFIFPRRLVIFTFRSGQPQVWVERDVEAHGIEEIVPDPSAPDGLRITFN